jgi:1,2-diacylglycerol 3-alpha-glucosyltransferase
MISLFVILKKHLSAFSTHKNAIYCPWGTDVNIFAAHEQRVKSDKVRFFHSCGMNAHRKGTDLLLKAYLSLTIADLKKSELIIHSQLSIDQLGEKLTCEEKKLFESYVKNNNIKIITKTVTAPGLYHLGDVYVYPSRLDGLGLTMAEAKSCSMPLIVPNDGPMNEFINQSIDTAIKINKKFARADGYYWPQNECSITDLTSGLVTYIENREQLSEWQEKARADALENYVWKKNSAFLLDKIKDISITPLDETVVKLCVAFNEKRFPKIYQWKTLYALAFKIYNSIFKS